MPIGALVLIKKLSLSVSVSVCVSGYAFRRASRHRAETWHGGRGHGPRGSRATFRGDPIKGQRSS